MDGLAAVARRVECRELPLLVLPVSSFLGGGGGRGSGANPVNIWPFRPSLVSLPEPTLGVFPGCGDVRPAGLAVSSAAVAQLVEHLLGKEEVMGSSPISSSRT